MVNLQLNLLAGQLLDEKDKKILNLLARNGRLSYRSLAQSTGLTTKSAKSRVDKMLASKVIKRFRVVVNPFILGYRQMHHLILEERLVSKDLTSRINLVGNIHLKHRVLGGGVGYAIAVKAGTEDKIPLLSYSLQPAVINIEHHEFSTVPNELGAVDYQIIRELLKSPRIEMVELGKKLSFSPKTVRKRLDKLERNRVLEFTILVNPAAMKGQIVFFLGIRVENSVFKKILEQVYSELQDSFIMSSVMSYEDMIGVVLAAEDAHVMESIRSRIELLEGVKSASVFLPIEVEIYDDWIIKEIESRIAVVTRSADAGPRSKSAESKR
jgi:DNA-binding Lrp family transcriptional regulator